ncbi:MAG: UDP-2,3-diacylglucosamine diphosphatase [Burkholderiales bacterium]|nr:UDP-2,3-diacylglucosamine diphosphatase [Burkholderiales bacterium]
MAELQAPPAWRSVEFISDLHLHPGEPATFDAWRRYMASTRADAVFILGDLFEAWPGDDAAGEPGFDAECAAVLRQTARQRPVFFMHGNRDFLVGRSLLDDCGVTLLEDPTVFGFVGQRWLLTHGDQLCVDDQAYLQFRAQVRDPRWQAATLAKPLAERRALARSLREQSEARQRSGEPYADVDEPLALQWLEAADALTMIHGHTHRPADHVLAGGRTRIVLSDWGATASPPRMQALRVDAAGARRVALA